MLSKSASPLSCSLSDTIKSSLTLEDRVDVLFVIFGRLRLAAIDVGVPLLRSDEAAIPEGFADGPAGGPASSSELRRSQLSLSKLRLGREGGDTELGFFLSAGDGVEIFLKLGSLSVDELTSLRNLTLEIDKSFSVFSGDFLLEVERRGTS